MKPFNENEDEKPQEMIYRMAAAALKKHQEAVELAKKAEDIDIELEETIDKLVKVGKLKPNTCYRTPNGSVVVYKIGSRIHCMIYENG